MHIAFHFRLQPLTTLDCLIYCSIALLISYSFRHSPLVSSDFSEALVKVLTILFPDFLLQHSHRSLWVLYPGEISIFIHLPSNFPNCYICLLTNPLPITIHAFTSLPEALLYEHYLKWKYVFSHKYIHYRIEWNKWEVYGSARGCGRA